ncbi:hypothetical protein ACLOJK_012499 [Asimina triloba]
MIRTNTRHDHFSVESKRLDETPRIQKGPNYGRPRKEVLIVHSIEYLAGELEAAALGVQDHQVVLQDNIEPNASLDDVLVNFASFRECFESDASTD